MRSNRQLDPSSSLGGVRCQLMLLAVSFSSCLRQPQVVSAEFNGKKVNLEGYSEDQIPLVLDDYSRQLQAAGETAEANRIADQASKMRRAEAEMSHGVKSIFLGFRPDDTLHQYAAFLRSSGDSAKAAQIDKVTDQYFAMQMWNFYQQQQWRHSQGQ